MTLTKFSTIKRLGFLGLVLFALSIQFESLTGHLKIQFLGDISAHAAEKNTEAQKWTCPMHPHYIADEFGSCPICGMDLVKLQMNTANDEAATKSDSTIISIPSETIQTMGVRLAKAEKASFGKRIRSFGTVKENERLQTVLSARVEGWVETLNITAVGDHVNKGDILFEIFSPELIVSQRDFLNALGQSKKAQQSHTRRLLSFGVQQQALALITKNRAVKQNLPFFAAQNGTVSELNVSPGSYVKRGMTIAKIQDYSKVWVIVNVSEKDMGFVTVGTKATIYFPNLPGRNISTRVDYIYPDVDEKTRTGQVRLVLDNPIGDFRPGTYADVVFETQIAERLSVPSEAILKDESGDYVVVALGDGRFTSRPVELGLVSKGRAEIKKGLSSDDEIVVSSQFLIDSESALRESFRKLERLQRPLHQLKLSKTDFAKFDHMVDAALYIHEALTDGYEVDGKFLEPAISIRSIMWADYKDTQLAGILSDSDQALKRAQAAKTDSEIKTALDAIVKALEPWLMKGAPEHYKAKGLVFFKLEETGQKWLQIGSKPINPYNKETAKPVPWPDKISRAEEKPGATNQPDFQQQNDKVMRGSNHAH